MKSTKTIEVNTADAIALCYIKDEFKEFNKKLIEFLKKTITKGDALTDLRKISHGEVVLFSRRVNQFYNENKSIIDIINSHSDIVSFIYNNYNLFDGKDNIEFRNDSFYQYILKNKEYSVKMFLVLNQIKSLGFKSFEFNEKLDFTNITYKVYNHDSHLAVNLVDNIEVIPGYDKESIEYKTSNSNYKITIFLYNREIIENVKKIYLNSLTFDVKTLPTEISLENLHNIFKNVIEEKKEEYTQIRSSVDLFVATSQLENTVNYLDNIINNIDGNHNKKDFIETLSAIKDKTMMLRILINFYENYLIEHNPSITKDLLIKEKKLYRTKKDN